jgi:hypothetical protein
MLLEKVNVPESMRGNWKIERFTTDENGCFLESLRGRRIPANETFTRLMRGGTLVMSDTPDEMRDHYAAVMKAMGSCLINGLGLGMVLKAVLKKSEVTDVTVVEISSEVLEMVSPHYQDSRVTFIHASAFDYQPPKGKRYGMVWHDIWDFICADNIPEMHRLHRKYGRRADWQGSWARERCERYSRQ